MWLVRMLFSARHPENHGDIGDAALSELYRHPLPETGVWLRSNFITSLDGSVSGANGRSGGINSPSDSRLFALHRAHCDVVLVGAGTARVEGYRAVDLDPWQREIRRSEGLSDFPALVIVSRSLAIEPTVGRAHTSEYGPVAVLTHERASTERADDLARGGVEVLRIGVADVDLTAAMDVLAGRNLRRVLCEGGPRLHRELLAADLVDSVSLSLAPVMVGGTGSRTTSGALLDPAPSFDLEMALWAEDQTVFTRYLRRGRIVPP
jgi:riboflavin-specific deaminase-like protein